MLKVWDGSDWLHVDAAKYWTGTEWDKNNKSKIRSASNEWLPRRITDKDVAIPVRWNVAGRTPPATEVPTYAVPNLIGLTQAAAISALQAANLNVGDIAYINTSVLSNDGKISSQSQQPNLKVPENSFVNIVVYDYKVPEVQVPALNGLTKSQAEQAITNIGLVVGRQYTQETYVVGNIGRVIADSQYPAPGTTVQMNDLVTFDYWIQQPYATMPNLLGQDEYSVYSALSAVNLDPGTRSTLETTNVNLEGKVAAQQYNAGQQLQAGTAVNYTVYVPNTTTTVPSIIGKTVSQAASILDTAELYLGTETTQETTNQSLEGTIVSQQYGSGTTRPVNTGINYVVYVPNTTTTVPNIVNQSTATATSLLTAAELYLGWETSQVETSNTALHNKIASQSPAAGTTQPVSSSVNYSIYIPLKTATVPSIIGQTTSTAAQTLSQAGFSLGYDLGSPTYTNVQAQVGQIVFQSLTGTQNIGASVNYKVYALNPTTTVPAFSGLDYASYNQALANAGLNVGTVTTVTTQTASQVGQVQSLSGYSVGQTVNKGTSINYVKYIAYVWTAVTVTKTGTAYIWSPQVSTYYGSGSRRAAAEPLYFGQYASTSTTGDQFSLINVTDAARDAACNAVSGNKPFSITAVRLNYTLESTTGNSTKPVYAGYYGSSLTGLPGTASTGLVYKSQQSFGTQTRGNSYSMSLNSSLRYQCFSAPSYPLVINSSGTVVSGYGSMTGVYYAIDISWTETTYV